MNDRFGIGWRPELAAGILSNLDRIDIVEVIADDYFDAPISTRRALKTLASQVPVALHGVTLGLASAVAADSNGWSERHGSLTKSSRSFGRNISPSSEAVESRSAISPRRREPRQRSKAPHGIWTAAKKIVGTMPLVENIAT